MAVVLAAVLPCSCVLPSFMRGAGNFARPMVGAAADVDGMVEALGILVGACGRGFTRCANLLASLGPRR